MTSDHGDRSENGRVDHRSVMSTTSNDITLSFSRFNAVTHDGIDRLMDLIQFDSFTLSVNGEELESTILEAI
jgi:hypothetical protein